MARDRAAWRWAVGLVLAACGTEDDGRASGSGGSVSIGSITTNPGESGGEGTEAGDGTDDPSGAASDDSGADGASGGTPYFDIGSADDGTGVLPDPGCQRVDFMFIVDNSVSMEDNQQS